MSRKAEHPVLIARISWKLLSFGVRTNGDDVGLNSDTVAFVGIGRMRSVVGQKRHSQYDNFSLLI